MGLVLVLALGRPVIAQVPRNLALDRFEPSPAGDAMLGVPDATVAPGFRPSFGLTGVYARDPLILVRDGDDHDEAGKVVTHQLRLHALASVDLAAVVKLDLDVPFVASQAGDAPRLGDGQVASPDSAVPGDVRLGLRLALVRQQGWVPSVAASGNVWFPSGDEDAYAGTGHTRHALAIHAGADHAAYLWRVAVGRRRGHDEASLEGVMGSEATLSAGGAVRVGTWWLGPELHGATVSGHGVDPFERSTTHVEALFTGRSRVGDLVVGAGAGAGLTRGIGTPSFRAILSVAFSPEVDWVALARDREQSENYYPDTYTSSSTPSGPSGPAAEVAKDRDGDGIDDVTDACPTVVGDVSGPRPGCPSDADGDGIRDMDDRCPQQPGVPSDAPDQHGCPPDGDGDGIVDSVDACPKERGPATADPATTGCPDAVRIVGTQIVISQTIAFATGKDDVAGVSEPVLTQVARLLEDHPDIARVAVDGHTDDVGVEKDNLALSRRRAVAVVRWLVAHGVDERRLEARGFGPRRPLVPNDGEQGRARNRRVEFQILRRTPLGEAGWKDGQAVE
jgi:outer membrane protein OmpA-like peptidoglycan-associated protein